MKILVPLDFSAEAKNAKAFAQKKDPAAMLVMFSAQKNFAEKHVHQSVTKEMAFLTDFPLMILKEDKHG